MEKGTKLIIAAVGLGGLGYFLYKKGLFSNLMPKTIAPVAPVKPIAPTKTTLKNAPTCPSGTKLQMVDVNCNGQNCEVHCVTIPQIPEWKEKLVPAPPPPTFVNDVVKVQPADPIFKAVPVEPIIFYPYTNIPVEVVVNPYVGVPENPYIPVTDNTFKPNPIFVENDPYSGDGRGGRGKGSLDYELNQMIYR
jgi:hypothetical protein